ncbi:MAG: amino acid ABC transporter permease [SAR324 cluster bacterium]|uniref:Amino acid ABC transporter permease n=1 Tax=SAR324 cluster bacterium TaxID=2024889 RepID=A0A2A4T827_9DELT|nr:MAG: amino acid ABC transporter permease [SAR324 cluster bacterium]
MWEFYFLKLMNTLPFFLKGVWVTISVSGLSLIAGTIIGFCFGIIRSGKRGFFHILIGLWVDLIRGTPFLIQIFIIFFILPEAGINLDAFPAAVIALSNMSACFICEIVSGGLKAVPEGQKEAAAASGFTKFQQLRYINLPQAMRTILPPLVGQYVLLIKDSSIVSAIGLVDITRVGWLTVQRVPEGLMVFGLVGILYFIICYPLILLSGYLEKRMGNLTPAKKNSAKSMGQKNNLLVEER